MSASCDGDTCTVPDCDGAPAYVLRSGDSVCGLHMRLSVLLRHMTVAMMDPLGWLRVLAPSEPLNG